ncbi:MAG: ribonuclease HI [Pseudomonadota bacterium]|nr:ribonuclease HI [Pseudomonadota bacterium]
MDIYTDGACSGNPGPGGWGVILKWGSVEREISGGELETTNNRMELVAVIEGLNALKEPCSVRVFTDSQYVQKGMTLWIKKWKAQEFRIKGGGVRVNHDLWRTLEALDQKHEIEWIWIKGHSGHPENERADTLARSQVKTPNLMG